MNFKTGSFFMDGNLVVCHEVKSNLQIRTKAYKQLTSRKFVMTWRSLGNVFHADGPVMLMSKMRICVRAKSLPYWIEFLAVADPRFWIRGVKFQKVRPKPPILCNVTVSLHFTWNDWNQNENWNLWK